LLRSRTIRQSDNEAREISSPCMVKER